MVKEDILKQIERIQKELDILTLCINHGVTSEQVGKIAIMSKDNNLNQEQVGKLFEAYRQDNQVK